MAKKTYDRPTVKTYGDMTKLTLLGAIERATGLSGGQILERVPPQYRDHASKWAEEYAKRYGNKLPW